MHLTHLQNCNLQCLLVPKKLDVSCLSHLIFEKKNKVYKNAKHKGTKCV